MGPAANAGWLAAAVLAAAAVPGAAQDLAPAGAANAAGTSLVEQALAFEHGEGVPRDQARAAELYCLAARDGDAEAQFGLAWMYANGRGFPRDDGAAAALFALAAAAGHRQAANMRAVVGDRGELPECMRPPAPRVAEPVPPLQDSAPIAETDPFADLPPAKRKIADAVHRLAPRYAIDVRLALAVIAVESDFQPAAVSEKDARGLMQLIPDTASRFNVKDPHDIVDNLRGGLAYLRWLLSYYRGHVALAAAAYNAGERAVDRYRGIPPYAETRDYVRRILELYGSDRHPYDTRAAKPSPALAGLSPRTP